MNAFVDVNLYRIICRAYISHRKSRSSRKITRFRVLFALKSEWGQDNGEEWPIHLAATHTHTRSHKRTYIRNQSTAERTYNVENARFNVRVVCNRLYAHFIDLLHFIRYLRLKEHMFVYYAYIYCVHTQNITVSVRVRYSKAGERPKYWTLSLLLGFLVYAWYLNSAKIRIGSLKKRLRPNCVYTWLSLRPRPFRVQTLDESLLGGFTVSVSQLFWIICIIQRNQFRTKFTVNAVL